MYRILDSPAKWERIYCIIKNPALFGLIVLLILTGRSDWLTLL